jgi:very-short-patch-repair endonuclease
MIYLRDQWPGSGRELALAVSRDELLRAGRYYLTQDTSLEVRRALAEGLRPTCVTAAKEHGLWVPREHGRHVYSRRGAAGAGWVGHGWHQRWPESDAIASPRLLLEHAAVCLDPLDVGILADSALHQGKVSAEEIAALARSAPRRTARVLSRVSGLSQSGTESKVRFFLQLHNVTVTPQVKIPGVGWVDNLVGRRWIIECDSREHHTGEDTYAKDRARDLRALELGYFTSRLTHHMVMGRWGQTSQTLLTVIRSGRHAEDPAKYAL